MKKSEPTHFRNYLIAAVLTVFSAMVVVVLQRQVLGFFQFQPCRVKQLSDHQKVEFRLRDKTYIFEVVNSPESLAQGLSGRPEIGSDGMLFIFTQTGVPSFWMKEMLFDLDLVWLKDFQVQEITPNVPKPAIGQERLPYYVPSQPVNMVLELSAGKAQELRLEVGDRITVGR